MRGAGLLLALALLSIPPCVEAHKPTRTKFTYHRDVRPIFEARCGSCHRDGGVAPMSLLTYKSTFPWAVSIKTRVLALSMPPWFADERYGVFHEASTLSAAEMNTIVDWCLGGTPEGDPGSAPAPASAPERSPGEPDLVLDLPEAFVLDAGTRGAFREVRMETRIERERSLRALEFRPDRTNVVRSAVLFVVPKGTKPGAPVASWVAGEGAFVWPDGLGVRLPAGSSIVARIHCEKTWLDEGKEIRDRSSLALYFSKGKATPVETLVIEAREGVGSHSLSRGVEVLSLLPRIEGPLESLLAEALLPDGTSVPLIRLRAPEPAWPRTYRLEEPLSLPKGSEVRLSVTSRDEASLRAAHRLVLNVVSN
jgi:hypothetical protein